MSLLLSEFLHLLYNICFSYKRIIIYFILLILYFLNIDNRQARFRLKGNVILHILMCNGIRISPCTIFDPNGSCLYRIPNLLSSGSPPSFFGSFYVFRIYIGNREVVTLVRYYNTIRTRYDMIRPKHNFALIIHSIVHMIVV